MLLFVGAGSKQSMENWCMRRCDCNLSLKYINYMYSVIIYFENLTAEAQWKVSAFV